MSVIELPDHVITTRCSTRTNSKLIHGRHGVSKRTFTRSAFSRSSLPVDQWVTVDGRHYTSVPVSTADIPKCYTIRKTGKTWTVLRDGTELPLALYSRKKDAQERIMRNAAGMDTINVA